MTAFSFFTAKTPVTHGKHISGQIQTLFLHTFDAYLTFLVLPYKIKWDTIEKTEIRWKRNRLDRRTVWIL